MSHSFFTTRQSGGIVSRLMADIALAQNFVGNAMTNIWMDLASCVFYLVVLFSMDVRLTLASLTVFPLYILCMRTLGKKSKTTSMAVQEAMEEFSGDIQERISGIHVVKAFATEQREARCFFAGARRLFHLTMENVKTTTLANSIVQWLTQMATMGLIWYGGSRLYHGYTNGGTVVAFTYLIPQLYLPVNRISEMNTILHNSLAAIDRIFEVFDIQPDVREKPDAIRLKRVQGAITLQNVTFSYPAFSEPAQKTNGISDDLVLAKSKLRQAVLHDVSLSIAPGEIVALVGPSGSGKSTLVQLIPRFYDPQSGRILIDGHDVKDLNLRTLRTQIGTVAQETLLFSGSARENLLYGKPDATEEEMIEAAIAARVHRFIDRLPDGYETVLGERDAGTGGQKQRRSADRSFNSLNSMCTMRATWRFRMDEAGKTSAAQAWRERIKAQQAGGQSIRSLCKQNGWHEHAFYWWRSRLGLSPQSVVRRRRRRIASKAQPGFAEVVVHRPAPPAAGLVDLICLRLGGGRELVLPVSMPLEQVAKLVGLIEASR